MYLWDGEKCWGRGGEAWIFAPEENISDLGLRDSDELLWKETMNILKTVQKPNGPNPFTHRVSGEHFQIKFVK